MLDRKKTSHQLNIAYLFQSIGTKFSESRAEQLHTLYTIRGLQKLQHHAVLLALYGKNVILSGDLEAITSGKLLDNHFAKTGCSGSRQFKLFERAIRRAQMEVNFPYLALFDSYRMYDACCSNLRGYDLIHERYTTPAVGGVLASKKLGIPFILEVNGDVIEQRAHRGEPERGLRLLLSLRTTRLCFDSAAIIICTSPVLGNHLIDKWDVDAGKVVILPCAVDVELFSQTYDPDVVRGMLGLTTEPVVMWIGGFHVWQDLDLLVKSFTMVLRFIPDVKLVMVGDGQTRHLVEQSVLESELQDAVVMVGAAAFERIPELLAAADVAVSPSPRFPAGHHGTPMKIFEYMAAGKAIVATNIDQIAAVIQDGHSGRLVEPGDVRGFANALVTLLQNPAERRRLGQNAKQQAAEQHTWDQYSRRLEEIYLSVL
jgi:glycosyltransferase involved in cell wall biosynthesis